MPGMRLRGVAVGIGDPGLAGIFGSNDKSRLICWSHDTLFFTTDRIQRTRIHRSRCRLHNNVNTDESFILLFINQ